VAWVDAQITTSLCVSCVSIAEIRYGIERAASEELRKELMHWLNQTLRPWFEGRILDIDEDVMLESRRIAELGRGRGRIFSQPDLLIAATAATHQLVVATRNVEDFADTGVSVFNPWLDAG
jgi:toxin FitB